jgi:hypothetical protein
MAYSERELFARLIKCEAEGEGIDGMKAVATVVHEQSSCRLRRVFENRTG